MADLSERYVKILTDIVDSYILTANPVGSRTLSKTSSLQLSAATIRNVMQDLEEMGYLSQPHTSAGRIPSLKGYKFFVDRLLNIRSDLVSDVKHLNKKIDHLKSMYDNEKVLLSEIGKLVSGITDCVSLIAFEKKRDVSVRKVSVVKIDERELMVVMILSDCEIYKSAMKLDHDFEPTVIERIEKYLNLNFNGEKISTLSKKIDDLFNKNIEGLEEVRAIMKDSLIEIQNVLKSDDLNIIAVGKDKIFEIPEFSDIEKIKTIINYVESKNKIKSLLNNVEDLNIVIGLEENNMIPDTLSVISAHIDQVDGYLSLIGPTRMNYRKNLSTLLNVVNQLKT